MADEKKKPDDGIEPWVTVQLQTPPPGAHFAAFIEPQEAGGFKVRTMPVAFFLLQHLSYDDDDGEQLDSRVIPSVALPTGELLELDAGRAGGPDHGFAGVAQSAAEAEKIGRAVADELDKARAK